jgi:hypothetical protein
MSAAILVTPAAAQSPEHEPNDSASVANLITLGDTVVGTIDPQGDRDYYAVDLVAGTKLEVVFLDRTRCYEFWVESPSGPGVRGDCFDGNPDSLYYLASVTGRYLIGVGTYEGSPSADPYVLRIGRYQPPAPGPGNPTRVLASGFPMTGAPWVRPEGTAADRTGGLYVATNGFISHVSASGAVSVVKDNVFSGFGAMAVDASGNLLVAAYEFIDNAGQSRGVVWRFTPSGEQSVFAMGPDAPSLMFTGIAIGPDGDVWLADPGMRQDSKIWRYDSGGILKETIDVSATGRAWNLAMSPHGRLHFVTQAGDIYRLDGRSPNLVGHTTINHWANPIVFDRDGYVYVSEAWRGTITLLDPQFRVEVDRFAQVLDSLGWSRARVGAGPVFLRDQSGNMTRRIAVARYCCEDGFGPDDVLSDVVLQLDESAVRAPGADVTSRAQPRVTAADISNALLGGASLPDSTVQALDREGNQNGTLDVGDLRAYLRQHGVAASAVSGGPVASTARELRPGRMTKQESDRLRALTIQGKR